MLLENEQILEGEFDVINTNTGEVLETTEPIRIPYNSADEEIII